MSFSEREMTKDVYEASCDVIEARMVSKTEGYGDAVNGVN